MAAQAALGQSGRNERHAYLLERPEELINLMEAQMLIIERDHPAGIGGVQKIYRFDNGYGASVVKTPFSYGGEKGLWELGVLEFTGEDYKLTYKTPITEDVLGNLNKDEIEKTLEAIKALPRRES